MSEFNMVSADEVNQVEFSMVSADELNLVEGGSGEVNIDIGPIHIHIKWK
jgi:hypothetical protein